MKSILQPLLILFLCIATGAFSTVDAQADAKLAAKARSMIGKKDKVSLKINTLKSNYAVIYCAKNAGLLTQKESDKQKRVDLLSEYDTKTSSVTRIPKGHLIGFLHNGTLKHVMISTGNGKAVGAQNKRSIGLGVDRVWEEISLQALKFDNRKGTFKVKGRDMLIVHRTASKFILQIEPDKNGNTVLEDGNDDVKNPDPTTRGAASNEKFNTHAEMDKYPWSNISMTRPDKEFEKHKKDFPELGRWQNYAAKANDMIRTMKSSKGSYKFSNPNLITEIYNDIFIYDKKERIVLRLDNKKKPATMFRVKNIGEFKSYINESINWYSKTKNPITQIKKEFKVYGKQFNFGRWSDYGYFAQQTLDRAVEKSKFKQNEFLLGRHNGYLVYYNKKDHIFIIGNKHEHEVITMFKLKDGEDEFNKVVEEKYTIKDPDKIDEHIHEYASVDSPLITGDEYEDVSGQLNDGEDIYTAPEAAEDDIYTVPEATTEKDKKKNQYDDFKGGASDNEYGELELKPDSEYGELELKPQENYDAFPGSEDEESETDYDDAEDDMMDIDEEATNRPTQVKGPKKNIKIDESKNTVHEYDKKDSPAAGAIDNSDYAPIGDEAFKDYDPCTNYTGSSKYTTRYWGKLGKVPGTRACMIEYGKSKKYFLKPNGKSVSIKEYIAIAYNFYENMPPNTLKKVLKNGDTALYHEKTNLLGIFSPEGKPRQLFKADKGTYKEIIQHM